MKKECVFLKDKHHLIAPTDLPHVNEPEYQNELKFIRENFCGNRHDDINSFLLSNSSNDPNSIVYLCGNIREIYSLIKTLKNHQVYVIKELSVEYDESLYNEQSDFKYQIISSGALPINIFNLGVYFRKLFDENSKNYFADLVKEHQFQVLTDSNKESNAFRKGIYLTNVERTVKEDGLSETSFNLLRCSSNLKGPTDNFRRTDHEIINHLNATSTHFFESAYEFNHVLAQIYENHVVKLDNSTKEKKAKIAAHSDKTKDMPDNALMAFCTFYENFVNGDFENKKTKGIVRRNLYDFTYSEETVLTKLHFKLKEMVNDEALPKEFSLTLYPGSVFMMSLYTNRIYTHAIRPSVHAVGIIPTRLGYVVRCSKTKAIFKNGETYIVDDSQHIKLVPSTDDGVHDLKKKYLEENITDNFIDYGKIYFSMNQGDYIEPFV
jgi:hypothetical protein